MEAGRVRAAAYRELATWGLQGWTVHMDRSKRRFGQCQHGRKRLSFSTDLCALNSDAEVLDVILHEVAHALAGGAAGHGHAWKVACLAVGARPERCYDSTTVVQPPAPYALVCELCGHTVPRHRRPARGRRYWHREDGGAMILSQGGAG